jgi:alkanesulfonate monooxygenase SsuD/methylene tetrahydromethanopterin reductase-like flavin-dependent oxidoreductase (luciferase family)
MDFGLGLMGYHGCWEDAAFAEAHGFSSAGFVDSPLIGGDPFVCLGLAAAATHEMRLGTFLAIPSLRQAATTASAIATVNRLAPGRTFLAMGTGFTGRAVFGLPRISAARLRTYALSCRALLDGQEVVHREGRHEQPIRFRHAEGRYVDIENRIPVMVAADGPKALTVAGEVGDGWVITLQYANVMENAADVFAGSWAQVQAAAEAAGRSLDDAYKMYSACVCVLEPGESAVSPRALEQVGMAAMMPFHAYADDPSIGPFLPPALQDRLEIYEREVQGRFAVAPDRYHQETHRGHLSHILEGEAEVLTDEIVRMTTLTGTAEEIARTLRGLEAAGLDNVSFWAPPHLTQEIVLDIERKVMPLVASPAAV